MTEPSITDTDRAAAEELCPRIYGFPPGHPAHHRREKIVNTYAAIIARHRSEREKTLEACLAEECEADTDARKAARQVLSEIEVDGDSYGVPPVADIIENLVKREKRLVEALREIDCLGDSCHVSRLQEVARQTLTELGYTPD